MGFHWSPSVGKPHMTGIFHQDYGIIRGLPMNRTRFSGHHLGSLFPGMDRKGQPNYCIGLDCVGFA